MAPSVISSIIEFANQHSPVVPVRYDAAADAVMVPEEFLAANAQGWTVVLHPCQCFSECLAALGY